jgi:hypothetical protein
MTQLWQLKNTQTNEALNDPQPLPENWGPIFGMSNIVDQLSDLSWLGEEYANQGWFPAGEGTEAVQSTAGWIAWEKAKKLLAESDWAVLSDVPMDNADRIAWIEYRRQLREIRSHAEFPNMEWPNKPE